MADQTRPGTLEPGKRLRAIAHALRVRLRKWPSVAMFADSKLLSIATLLLGAAALSPLFVTPFLPLVDLGSNVGAAFLLDDAAWGGGLVAKHYAVQPGAVPYWTGYLALAVLEPILGVLWATKAVIGLIVLLMPIATMRLLVSLGRSPLLGLWVFMLTWDINLFWGWFTFQLGMGLALWALAWLIEMKTKRDALRLALLGAVIALTHVHAVAFAAVVGGLITLVKRPLLRSLALSSLAFLGFAAPVVLWLATTPKAVAPPGSSLGFDGVFHDLSHHLAALHAYALDNIPEAQWQTVTAVLLVLLAPALMSALPERPRSTYQRLAPMAFLAGTLLLYLALPYEVRAPIGHFWTYPRFATYVLIALLLTPTPNLQGLRSLLLLPGVVMALLISWTIRSQFQAYGEYTKPYLDIVAAIPQGSRLLPLDLDDFRYKGTRMPSVGQLHGYAAAMTSSYDGHLFENPNNPLLFRPGQTIPHPVWYQPHTFTMASHGKYYDYIIVHSPERDPFKRKRREAKQVGLVREAGPWRLYQVKSPVDFP